MSFTDAIKSGFDHYVKVRWSGLQPAYWWVFLFAILVAVAASDHRRGNWLLRSHQWNRWIGPCAAGPLSGNPALHEHRSQRCGVLIGLIPIVGSSCCSSSIRARGDGGENATAGTRLASTA
jgi:hypothetical protein